MKVLADSHAIFWLVADRNRLSDAALAALSEAEETDGIAVSAASFVDLWYTTQKGGPSRIKRSDYDQVVAMILDPATNVEVLPLTHLVTSHLDFGTRNDLPDPFDRMIVATALECKLPIVTADKLITSLGVAPIIW